MDSKQLLICIFLCHLVNGLDICFGGYLPSARGNSASIYDTEDSIYIFGGRGGDEEDSLFLNEIVHYNITSKEVKVVARFTKELTHGSVGAFLRQESFFYFGGSGSKVIWKWERGESQAKEIGNLPFPSSGHSSISDTLGNIYIIGGMTLDWIHLPSILKFSGGKITTAGNTVRGVFGSSAVYIDGSVFILGGVHQGPYPHNLTIFNTQNGESREIQIEMNGGLVHFSAVHVKDYIYMFGGIKPEAGFGTHELSRLDIRTNTIEYFRIPNIGVWRGTSAVYVEKLNRIYVFGGFYIIPGHGELARAEILYIQLD